jgi:hypothetical protein
VENLTIFHPKRNNTWKLTRGKETNKLNDVFVSKSMPKFYFTFHLLKVPMCVRIYEAQAGVTLSLFLFISSAPNGIERMILTTTSGGDSEPGGIFFHLPL